MGHVHCYISAARREEGTRCRFFIESWPGAGYGYRMIDKEMATPPLVLEPSVLHLTKNKARQERIRAKMEEYRDRIAALELDLVPDKMAYLPPEHIVQLNMQRDSYKLRLRLMDTLFKKGQVDSRPFVRKKLTAAEKVMHANAWTVVHDYHATGGRNLLGGTGLQPLPKKKK